ncbi:hypothetical protein L226DRAFT_256752 [Lentinus tigrinus ALCF2SS1-7]|uniref:uncharacterized protein n=1 Tax=Lentinus tigrinus ALCF2SS1-7 TaxID=1328758 RepID=UPI00116615BA|nr:hypothetical protein L226DRAFT_256752 [Lentinus tigrinus ALCF2SS1-7]
MAPLKPYAGPVRKLVLGIDVGTTYSGISYAILDPGEVPKIQGVTRFPGQENAAGDSKIPTILYYRPDGTVHSAGAEAAVPGIELDAEDEDLFLSKWFKLHLRPEHLDSNEVNRRDLPPLPTGKTVVQVFADFLEYLVSCTQRYITSTHASGESLWNSLKDQIDFVLSHPNGWEGLQQGKMRQAAVLAKLVPDNAAGHARIHFVTEGEASLHFCVQSGLTTSSIETGESVMIVDAGGGTVDISSYSFTSTTPISVEEIATAECIMQGSTRVNVRAEKFLKERLKNSAYGNEEDIKTMLDYFDKFTKPVFKDSNETSYIKFGSMGCNDPKVKIRRGQLQLTGAEMESFFQPALDSIVATVQRQRQTASQPITTVFLVGGFAASPWLFNGLQKTLQERGMALCRPDTHTSKAVSEGAVSFYLDRFVSARLIRTTYGVSCNHDYVPNDPEHATRTLWRIIRPSGRVVLPNGFSPILTKGTRVREHQEMSRCYFREAREQRTLNRISTSITCYKGNAPDPHWMDVESEMYTPLCTIHADTSKVTRTPRQGSNGTYYVQVYNIILQCGLTELKAQISWTQDGEEKRGPATIVYDDELEEYR